MLPRVGPTIWQKVFALNSCRVMSVPSRMCTSGLDVVKFVLLNLMLCLVFSVARFASTLPLMLKVVLKVVKLGQVCLSSLCLWLTHETMHLPIMLWWTRPVQQIENFVALVLITILGWTLLFLQIAWFACRAWHLGVLVLSELCIVLPQWCRRLRQHLWCPFPLQGCRTICFEGARQWVMATCMVELLLSLTRCRISFPLKSGWFMIMLWL